MAAKGHLLFSEILTFFSGEDQVEAVYLGEVQLWTNANPHDYTEDMIAYLPIAVTP